MKTPSIPKFTKINMPTKPGNGVLSPDGKKLAYISKKSLWLVPVRGNIDSDIVGEPVRLTDDSIELWDLANMGVVWSANDNWLAFYAMVSDEDGRKTDGIFVVSVNGGSDIDLLESSTWSYEFNFTSYTNKLLFTATDFNNNVV